MTKHFVMILIWLVHPSGGSEPPKGSLICEPYSICATSGSQGSTCPGETPPPAGPSWISWAKAWGASKARMSNEDRESHTNMLIRHAATTQHLNVLHVGTHNLKQDELAWYRQLQLRMRARNGTLRLFLVEPQASIFQQLQYNIREVLGPRHRAQFIEAALCLQTNDANASFYALSHRIYEDFPAFMLPKAMITQISSFSRSHMVDLLMQFAQEEDILGKPGVAETYVETILVRCLSAQGLLKEASLNPADIDVLVTDLEGYDTQLLPFFLTLEGFRPQSLIFEHLGQLLPDLVTRWTVQELASRGYVVHCHFQDVVAYLQQ